MKKFKILILSLFLFCGFSYANVYDYPSKLENISKNMPQMDSIKCKFKQEKNLKNIAKPLVSSGDFEFIKNKGVYFHTTYPVKSTTDYTNKNYKQVNDIINAISSRKYSKLEKDFDFYYTASSSHWSLGMKPKKNSNAHDYIAFITIDGEDYIRQITISQTNGNKTSIWFTK